MLQTPQISSDSNLRKAVLPRCETDANLDVAMHVRVA
jgi:hypothetical protein